MHVRACPLYSKRDDLTSMIMKKILIALLFIYQPVASCITPRKRAFRIGYWGTSNIACGIAMYTTHQADALRRRGYMVFTYGHFIRGQALIHSISNDKINLLNIQYESKIMPVLPELLETILKVKASGVKVIVTVHEETSAVVELVKVCDRIIYHKKPMLISQKNRKLSMLPMGKSPSLGLQRAKVP